MQAEVGSSTGQVPCVKWTRGWGRWFSMGSAAAVDGRRTSFMACGILLSGRIAASDNVLCAVRTTWCLVIWRDVVATRRRPGRRICALEWFAGTNNILTVELQSVVFACVSGTTSHSAVGTQY